jgi:phosphomannomutase
MDYLRRAGDIGAYEEMSYSLPTPLVHELSTKTEGLRGTLEEDDPHLAKDITTGLLKILSKRKRLNKDTPITDDVRVACLNAVQWGIDTRRNGLGIALALTRALKDHNCLLVGDE